MKKVTEVKQNMKKRKKKHIFRKIFLILFLALLVGVIIYSCKFVKTYNMHKDAEEHYDPLSATALGIDPEKMKNVGRMNILVIGESDANQGLPYPEYYLADTIMVVSYNPQTQQASILSIPRDTYTGHNKNNATSSDKINSAYRNKTQMDNLLNVVNDLTGLEIENYVTVNTEAIREIVDAIGGVWFNVPIDMDYDDDSQDLYIHLTAGEQLLDGEKAEQLLRFRHNNDYSSYDSDYGDNDFGRMRTQREFIQETAKQLLKIENVPKAVSLLDIVYRNVETNVDMDTIKCYIPYVFKFDPENIQSDFVPGRSEKCNGVWLYIADKEETKQVVEDLFTDRVYEEVQDTTEQTNGTTNEGSVTGEVIQNNITVEILNGTDNKDILGSISSKLKQKGYSVVKTGTTSATEKTTIINRTKQEKSTSNEIKDELGVGIITSGSDNSNVDYTIIIGTDYE